MKRVKRRLLRDARGLISALVAGYIRLMRRICRWRVVRGEIPDAFWQRGEPFIACCWHGRLLMMPPAWRRGRPVAVLISRHRDGALIAATIRRLGIDTLWGSSGRGGALALLAMVGALEEGTSVGITPDGPRGPRMRASGGIVDLARRSGRPIVPAAYGVSRRHVFDTWDRFVMPLPFASGVYVWGTPIRVAPEADARALERARLEVEARLNEVTAEADRLVGQSPVTPDPVVAADAQAER